MAKFARHVEQETCRCTPYVLVRCGVLPDAWPGWREITFAGEARVAMVLLTRREPPVWPGPRQRWAGTTPWFNLLGLGVELGEGDMMACPHEDDHRLVERLLAMYLDGADPSRIVSALGEEQTRRLKQLCEAAREAETYSRLVIKYGRQR